MTTRYRSNLRTPDFEPAFVHAREMDPNVYSNPMKHTILCDPEVFGRCGYATHDEAAILAHCVQRVTEGHPNPESVENAWAEIGSHTGWTTAHIGIAATRIAAIDPEYSQPVFNNTGAAEQFARRFDDNIERVHRTYPLGRVNRYGVKSSDFFKSDAAWPKPASFDGVFVDGEHEPPFPLEDAKMIVPFLKERAVVVFHDCLSSVVREGVKHLRSLGFQHKVYDTPQIVIVCWRGDYTPPNHTPDPNFDWARWKRSIGFDL